MIKQKFVIFLILSSVTKPFAQKLDLETCLKMADTANLNAKNAYLETQIIRQKNKAFNAARLPHISYSGDYKYNAIIPGQVVPAAFFGGAPGTFSTVQFGVPYNLSNTLQLNQLLYNPQENYGLAALRINGEIVAIQQRIVEQDVRQQVGSTFFNLQAIIKQLAFVDGNIANMDKLIQNMKAMVQQEMAIQTEVDKLQINRLTLENSKQSLESSKIQLESYLKLLTGMNQDAQIQIETDGLVEKSLLIDVTTKNYLELELLASQQKMNIEERKGTKMAYLPNLSFYGTYNYNYNMKPENDYRVGIKGAFIGLRMDWTLFDGFEKHHNLQINALNAEKLANQHEFLSQQAALNEANTKRQISLQTKALELSKEQLTLAENVYHQTELKFEQGLIGTNELITADNNLQQAQTNVVSAYVQLRQAELSYLRTIGNIH
jgi:outer membrane protein TolC